MTEELKQAFDEGWRMAAEWANRDDLIPDMDSPHYANERSDRLASLPTQPAAQATPDVPETDFGKMATPEPVGEARCEGCGYMTHHREHMGCVRAAKQHTRPAPGVPDVQPNEMESKWCWWLGDGERFHVADNEPEAHGEAQSRIDDDCDPGQTHQYSVARVQHPLDAIGMDWLALHVAESIAENVCCWCDDNTGAEEPSIMLSPDDSKALGLMVATFLRQRVGVDGWTADQKTVTVHTYVSGSNDDPTLAAAQAKGGE